MGVSAKLISGCLPAEGARGAIPTVSGLALPPRTRSPPRAAQSSRPSRASPPCPRWPSPHNPKTPPPAPPPFFCPPPFGRGRGRGPPLLLLLMPPVDFVILDMRPRRPAELG